MNTLAMILSLRHTRWAWLPLCGLLCAAFLSLPQDAAAEGSRNLHPDGTTGSRANLEWRNSTYGGRLLRRTLLKVYADAGEYILMGSSAVDVPDTPDNGDILVYEPGLVNGMVGAETIPATPSFSCLKQREATHNASQGRISSRLQEISGPMPIIDPATATPGNGVPNGYIPCFYKAEQPGIYDVVFYGPIGDGSDRQIEPTGALDHPANYTAAQATSVAVWDVTVRGSLTSTADLNGRLFAYYLGMSTGANGRPIKSVIYVVTGDGFQYRVDLHGMDPYGYELYANQVGFLDSDGVTPLYHDVLAVSSLPFQDQNQLLQLQGGVSIAPPQYPLFFSPPAPAAIQALGIPPEPFVPAISDFTFTGPAGDHTTRVGEGGTFSFTSNVGGVYEIVISRDGRDFDPTNPQNRVLRGTRVSDGVTSVQWDGLDNSGTPFPAGTDFVARTSVHGGEFHFPFLDVENSREGSPTLTLLNPPGGVCPPLNGGCSGAFYDDRGYRTANGTLVGTAVNGPLCPGSVGNPPAALFSDPLAGFDSTSTQRGFGFATGGNGAIVCDANGGFGDKQGLDLWTYYPGSALTTPLQILTPTSITLVGLTATRQRDGIAVRWETSAEQNTWGFHLLRSADGRRAGAARITPALIPGQGRGQGGASYSWIDQTAQPGLTYSYWLQEIELDNTIHEYGPVRVANPATDAAVRIFIPFVRRGV